MTRFARRGFENRKLNEATPWSDFKKSGSGRKPAGPGVQKTNFKDRRREERRQKRRDDREAKKVCYSCRNPGHMMSECPFLSEANQQNMCFKCGSTEHSSLSCQVKISKDSYPFAQCFICGKRGHISKQCPDNPRGLYPRGGCCKCCGSVEHLKRDCPEFLGKKATTEITADIMSNDQSVDAQPIPSTSSKTEEAPGKKKKTKIVKF